MKLTKIMAILIAITLMAGCTQTSPSETETSQSETTTEVTTEATTTEETTTSATEATAAEETISDEITETTVETTTATEVPITTNIETTTMTEAPVTTVEETTVVTTKAETAIMTKMWLLSEYYSIGGKSDDAAIIFKYDQQGRITEILNYVGDFRDIREINENGLYSTIPVEWNDNGCVFETNNNKYIIEYISEENVALHMRYLPESEWINNCEYIYKDDKLIGIVDDKYEAVGIEVEYIFKNGSCININELTWGSIYEYKYDNDKIEMIDNEYSKYYFSYNNEEKTQHNDSDKFYEIICECDSDGNVIKIEDTSQRGYNECAYIVADEASITEKTKIINSIILKEMTGFMF